MTTTENISDDVAKQTGEEQVPQVFAQRVPNIVLKGGYIPPKPTSTSKWIKPTNSVCKANGGKIVKDGCIANWENAKKICLASGGKLPTRDDFHKVITNCGGIADANSDDWDKNKNNNRYQSCYKQKGFSSTCSTWWYWTSETYKEHSSYAWFVHFKDGFGNWCNKSNLCLALCVR